MPLPIVLATAVPKKKAAVKFQKAAHATARNGVRTRVETTVAMELAASCQPLENSNASVRPMTARRREKLSTGVTFAGDRAEIRQKSKGVAECADGHSATTVVGCRTKRSVREHCWIRRS